MEPAHTPWHALTPTEVAVRLGCDPRLGLDEAEAERRRAEHGENALHEPARRPWWRTFLRQFRELVIGILLVAAGLSAALGDWADTAAIVAIVLVNALIGFLQEERAYRALAALERMAAPLARAVRGGSPQTVPARHLVPGDRILLEAGDRVPADARLLEAYGLLVQEAALTGESAAVEKGPAESLPAATPLGDRRSMVHAGTVVAAGRGAALVVETGMRTELGRIAGLLERVTPEPTTLERRLAELGRLLVVVCLAVVGLIFAVELWRGGGFAGLSREGLLGEVLLRSLSLAVAAVPEGLPAVVTLVLSLGLQRMVARGAIVRRLPSVETLGSVTVICSDKTGTLTRNEMTLREIVTAGGRFRVSGVGYVPQGEFRRLVGAAEAPVTVAAEPDLGRLLLIGARCTNASVRPGADGGDWEVVGDPTEGALVVAALKGGVAADAREPVVYELPFDSSRKLMSVVVRRHDGSRVLETKGATEAVLARCVAELHAGRPVPLTAARRGEILAAAAGLADRFRLLTGTGRGVPSRQQSLRTSIDWSYDLLGEEVLGLVETDPFTQHQLGRFTVEDAPAPDATVFARLMQPGMHAVITQLDQILESADGQFQFTLGQGLFEVVLERRRGLVEIDLVEHVVARQQQGLEGVHAVQIETDLRSIGTGQDQFAGLQAVEVVDAVGDAGEMAVAQQVVAAVAIDLAGHQVAQARHQAAETLQAGSTTHRWRQH